MLSVLVVAVFIVVGSVVRIPYVALGPGPTHDTLGEAKNGPVIKIDGTKSYETNGQLRLTTVSVANEISLINGLGMWMSGRYALAPRELYFPPGESDEDVKQANVRLFQDSQSSAEVAALRHLKYPVKVLAKEIVTDGPSDGVLDPGDEVVELNGEPVAKIADVHKLLKATRPGDKVSVTVQSKDGKKRTEPVTLGKADDERQQGYMGVLLIDQADVPFTIDIKLSEEVGGPSAGLMFALAIVDRLTPGQLTGGKHIAGTGEMSEQGKVGAIGGISFKLVAARESGATTFLVPEENCPEAARTAPEGLRLVKVRTLGDAVSALKNFAAGKKAPSC